MVATPGVGTAPVSVASSEFLLSERYEALIRVSQAIGAHRDPEDLFAAMAKELHRVVQFDGIVVAQYDEASNEILWSACEVCSQQGPVSPPDIPADDRWLATVSAELADGVFLMWAPRTEDGTLQRWVDRLWGLGLEGKTILTIGRRRAADPSLPKHASQFVLEIPEDRAIRDRGNSDMAWAVANSSAAGRQARQGGARGR